MSAAPGVGEGRVLSGNAVAAGFRMPAEWEPLERVWLVRPHNPETWPGCLDEAQEEWEHWRRELQRVVPVVDLVAEGVPTNDSWIRDFGPVFVRHPDGRVAGHDFQFNGWGGKYEVRNLDNDVPEHLRRRWGLDLWRHELVLEGGSIDTDGRGTLLTTRQCLENTNRGSRDAAGVERALREALGVSHVIWLPGGIRGDDTDGHIDDIARFVAPGVVAAIRAGEGHPDHDVLEENWRVLAAARDATGAPLELLALPVPEEIEYDFPPDRFGPGGRSMVPASHANFLVANGSVFVPAFGGSTDEQACRLLESAMPGHRAIPIPARHLVVGLGSLHCLSCQQPSAGRSDGAQIVL